MLLDNILEQGASTFDASVREIQKTYDEVVWGVESPPLSYVEKKEKVGKNGRQYQHPPPHGLTVEQYHLSRQGTLKTATTAKKKKRHVPRTPSSSPAGGKKRHRRLLQQETNDGKNLQSTPTTDVDDSWGEDSTLTGSSSSSSASEADNIQLRNNNKLRSSRNDPPGFSSKHRSKQQSPRQQHGRQDRKLESSPTKAVSIDEIFGYNTKQRLTRTKIRHDEDVGLDVCVLDVPSSDLNQRSLLIVKSIDPAGIFAKTDLGVGDAILSINGVSFKQQPPPYAVRRENMTSSASGRPNLFQARTLLNGRGRTVAIEYQKFGETTTPDHIERIKQKLYATKESSTRSNSRSSRKKRFSSAVNSRKFPTSARVDFLGMLRTTGGSTRKNRSTTLEHTASTAPLSDSEKTEEEDHLVDVEAPPKISRLTRIKEKTQKIRSANQKKSQTSKKRGGKKGGVDKSNCNKRSNAGEANQNIKPKDTSNEPLLPPENNQMAKTKEDNTDASVLPYCSLLNNGSQGQIQLLLNEQVFSTNNNTANPPAKTIDENLPSESDDIGDNSIVADAENLCSTPNNKAAVVSPARSTRSSRSESYLQDLRKGLSPTANAILQDLSAGIAPYTDAVVGKPIESESAGHFRGGSNSKPQGPPIPVDGHEKEMIRVDRKVFEKLHQRIEGLKKSNMQLNNELASLKRKRNDSVQKLADAKKELEHVEAKEQVYVSQLDLVKSRLEIASIQADKRQRELQVSKERSIAENDKVIAVLTKRIEGMEKTNQRLVEQLKRHEVKRQEKTSTLQAQYDRLKMKFSAQSTLLDNVMTANEELTSQNEAMEAELMNYGGNVVVSGKPPLHSSASFFAEGSENEMEHIKRDPILLAQAKDLSFYRERTSDLEEQVESLSNKLQALKELEEKAQAAKPIEDDEFFSECNDAAIETAPSLFDVLTSSGEDDPKSSHSRRSLPQETKVAQDLNTFVENPSYAGTTFKLKYQHHYETTGASSDADDETVSTKSHRVDQRSSLVLMKRILELETTFHDINLDPKESEQFVKALQSRISQLAEKGYAKVGSVEVMTDVREEQYR